jgi:hypothetical protein
MNAQGDLYTALRDANPKSPTFRSQTTIAESVGRTQHMISMIENGHEKPSGGLREHLDRVLALGDPPADPTIRLHYVLAGGWRGYVDILRDGVGRFGVFKNRDVADAAAALLQTLGLRYGVAPCWPSFLMTERPEPLPLDDLPQDDALEHLSVAVRANQNDQ